MVKIMETFNALLPQEYQGCIVKAVTYEKHLEPSLRANKVIGYDKSGAQCFYYHTFTLTEECFDIDEFPLLVDVYYERVVAWRHTNGQWLKLKSFLERPEDCNKKLSTLPLELISEMPR